MKLYLKCQHKSHKDLLLADGITHSIGRTVETGIQDKRCSRKQIELTANYKDKTVSVRQLGSKSSFIDDKEIIKGNTAILHEGETLYVVQQDFPHCIEFIPSDDENDLLSESKKRTIDDYFGMNKLSTKKQKLETEAEGKETEKEDVVKNKLKILQQDKTLKLDPQEGLVSKINRGPGWYHDDETLLVYESADLVHSSKVIAFDMDGTLITTKSGKTFAVDWKDWKILYDEVPIKLKKLYAEGYKLVIITNQLGIGKGKVKESDFKRKVEDIIKSLSIPFQVLATTNRGKYRKPNIGTWNWLNKCGNNGIDIKSFSYVGDAAGRPKNWAPGKKKDFSASDRLFAINLEVPFHTPEEFFLSHKPAKFELPQFDPKSLKDKSLTNDESSLTTSEQELIIMVGYPASGKSTFAKNYLASNGYVVVNRDTLKTWQKCVAVCESELASGKSVVIDNTNPDKESRQRYIACAKKRGCSCRCFVMNVTLEHAMHNNRFRELSGFTHDVVPRMILYSYRKKYEEPNLAEGFSKIVKVNFVPNFNNEDLKKMYFMFTD